MRKTVSIISYALYGVYAGMCIFFMVFYKMGIHSFDDVLYATMVLGFAELILMVFWVLDKNEIKRLTGAIHVSYVVLACIIHYVLVYAGHYPEYKWLYWGLFFSLTIIMVITMTIINFKLKPQRAAYKRK